MAHANMDYHMDFISLLSLSNIGVLEPQLVLAQKKQAALAPEALQGLSCTPGWDGHGSTSNGCCLSNGSNGLTNGNGFEKLNGVKRRRGQLECVSVEEGWGLPQVEEDPECPTKV